MKNYTKKEILEFKTMKERNQIQAIQMVLDDLRFKLVNIVDNKKDKISETRLKEIENNIDLIAQAQEKLNGVLF